MRKHSIFWAIVLLSCGGLLLLNSLNIGIGDMPTLEIVGSVLLLAISISSLVELNFFFGLLPLSVILYLWRDYVGVPDMRLWPVMLGAGLLGIGLSMIFGRFRKNGKNWFHCRFNSPNGDWSPTNTVTSTDENETVVVESTFGEHVKYVRSTNLKNVKAEANFSSIKIYFDQCMLSPEGAQINVEANFAGVFLYIPRTWNIDNRMKVFAGSVEGASNASGDFKTVLLTGECNFANVKIIYL